MENVFASQKTDICSSGSYSCSSGSYSCSSGSHCHPQADGNFSLSQGEVLENLFLQQQKREMKLWTIQKNNATAVKSEESPNSF